MPKRNQTLVLRLLCFYKECTLCVFPNTWFTSSRMMRKIYKNLAFLIAATGNFLVFLPLFRLFKKRYPCYAVPNANICIEGFPRSGNSFFVMAFQQWNPGTTIAHHSHLASNAKYSVKQDKPTVILIREPAEAIASAIAWDGQDERVVPGVGLITYVVFYQSLRKYKQEILFLDFYEAINQPDKCIAKINQRFDTNFSAKEFTKDENIRLRNVLVNQDMQEKRTELNSSLPNERKSKLKMAIVPKISAHSLYARAHTLYAEYIACASENGNSSID
jgi:hypothetical protein